MEIKNGAMYESNYGRAGAYYLGTCVSKPEGEERGQENVRLLMPEGCAKGLKELDDTALENSKNIDGDIQGDKAYVYFSRCVLAPKEPWIAKALPCH